jgi:hypothetical protein
MSLNWTGGQITGAVSGDGWSSPLYAEIAAASETSGEYTLLLQPDSTNADANVPPGDGYLLLTNHLGKLVFSGALADGVALTPAPALGRLGDVPIFQNLYGNAGLILGWLTLTNGAIEATPLMWIKPSTDGFNTGLSVVASGWTNPPPTELLADGLLTISGAGFDMSNTVSVSSTKLVQGTNAPISLFTGTVNAKTGLLTVTFGTGSGKTTASGHGVFLQNSNIGGGYFLYKNQPGAIWVTNQ